MIASSTGAIAARMCKAVISNPTETFQNSVIELLVLVLTMLVPFLVSFWVFLDAQQKGLLFEKGQGSK